MASAGAGVSLDDFGPIGLVQHQRHRSGARGRQGSYGRRPGMAHHQRSDWIRFRDPGQLGSQSCRQVQRPQPVRDLGCPNRPIQPGGRPPRRFLAAARRQVCHRSVPGRGIPSRDEDSLRMVPTGARHGIRVDDSGLDPGLGVTSPSEIAVRRQLGGDHHWKHVISDLGRPHAASDGGRRAL